MTFKSFGYYMRYATELAEYMTGENIRKPHVGAVVASKSGEVIGEGYLKFIPGTSLIQHAERVALDEAGEMARDGTLFTTLEPCVSTTKRSNVIFTSCSELIVERGIQRVIFGDYDARYNGEGIKFLEKNGIKVFRIAMDFRNLGRSYSSNRLRTIAV